MTGLEMLMPWILIVTGGAVAMGAVVWSIRRGEQRRRALAATAQRLGWGFQATASGLAVEDYRNLHVFSQGRERTYRNILTGKPEGTAGVIICDYQYTTGDGRGTRTCRQTVALLTYEKGDLPRFELRPETVFDKIGSVFGYQDIDFKESPEFSKRYLLRGPDEAAVRALFGLNLRQYFESHPGWCVDGRGAWLAAYRHGLLVPPEAFPALLDELKLLIWTFPR
jgi:hypothetical protein